MNDVTFSDNSQGTGANALFGEGVSSPPTDFSLGEEPFLPGEPFLPPPS